MKGPFRAREFLPLIPPAVLVLVALGQVHLTRSQDLTPWKGGGFGMFSTSDGDSRMIQAWVGGPLGERKFVIPESWGTREVKFLPSTERLMGLGERIAADERSRGVPVERVRVVVLRAIFDVETMKPRYELIREATIEIEDRRGAR